MSTKEKGAAALDLSSPEQKTAWEELNEAAREAAQVIVEKEQKSTRVQVVSRWDIGRLILDVLQNVKKYGERTVERLAVVTNLRGTSDGKREAYYLYELRDLAQTWERKELEDLIQKAAKLGHTLTISHFLELKRAVNAKDRKRFTDACLKEGWSVVKLRDEMHSAVGGPSKQGVGRKPAVPKNPRAATQQIDKVVGIVTRKFKGWDEVLFNPLKDRNFRENLNEDERLQEDLRKTTEELIDLRDKLTSRIEQCQKALAGIGKDAQASTIRNGVKKKKKNKKRQLAGAGA